MFHHFCQAFRPLLLGAIVCLATAAPLHAESFVNFESGHVRPLARSPDGGLLFAVNTPDDRLAIYTVTPLGLTLAAEVVVGLEPVAVAARTNGAGRTEAWVVNQLSDSVSVVEIDAVNLGLSRVTRTLFVGDEPRDVVFAGPGLGRAFITAAHRGQNRPGDPQLTTPGVGRADVWSFDADDPGGGLGGTPLSIIQLFGDTPRALAVSPDGLTVYAAVFQSGNRTMALPQAVVSANGGSPPPPPGAAANPPDTALIVKFNLATARWEDEIARDWTAIVPFSLPDRDVFLIDANADPPGLASGTNAVSGVGTVLFNMAVRPSNGKLYVANTEARNEIRFEPVLTGHLAESRITVVDGDGTSATPRHLNPHIDYDVVPGSQAEIDHSLAFPMGMAFSSDGATLYVAAFGSGKVGVFDAAKLESGIVDEGQVAVGGGPTGLLLDEAQHRLFVMNRFDQTISIVSHADDPAMRAQTAVVSLRFDPEPAAIRNGRRFLYDARTTSAHGDAACASCHLFGDMDGLAWDLGNPFGTPVNNPNPFVIPIEEGTPPFHPMKGPMTTQSLRGMANAGPMHWRGDRTAGNDPGGDPLDEDGAFKKFNPAFVGLLGRGTQLTAPEMQAFTDFILTVRYPPNPIRALDNSLTPAQIDAQNFFSGMQTDGLLTCNSCHRLPLGTEGISSADGETQEFKVPHLRNLYQKIGMFGMPDGVPGIPATGNLGDQVRGFGFIHDGSTATVFDFLNRDDFQNLADPMRRSLEQVLLAFDTGLRPAVGQQVSLTSTTLNDAPVTARIDLLIARADAGDCDLVVKGNIAGEARGAVYVGGNSFQLDRNNAAPLAKDALHALAASAGQEQVYTCVPPGSGTRIGVDRDEDGFFDRTEIDAGSDPANAAVVPVPPTPVLIRTSSLTLTDDATPPVAPSKRKLAFRAFTKDDAGAHRVVPPAARSAGDPTAAGATSGGAVLTVYNSNGSGEKVVVALPATGWQRVAGRGGTSTYRFRGHAGEAISQIVVKTNWLTIRGGGSAWSYTLDEPAQGRVAVRLLLGTTQLFCADAPANASGNPPSTARNDHVDRFVAEPKTPAPAVCPPVP